MVLLTLGMWLLGCEPLPWGEPVRRPNIVFILADDLGCYDLGCDGRAEHTTPHLDQLAREGIRLTAGYAASPVCSPTRAALLTGQHPARLHLTTFLPGRADAPAQKLLQPASRPHLPATVPTLAERLRAAGYATACIGKWHLGGGSAGPRQRGFDVVHFSSANSTPSATEGGKSEFELTAQAEAFLTQHSDRPFFLFLAHHNPHIPLAAPPDAVARFADTYHPTYAAMIHTLDASIGRLLRRLDELKLAEHTLVIFTSDNGGLHVPELGEAAPTHHGRYRAGKGFLYEGGIRVPVLIRWPKHLPAGKTLTTPMISTDWLPTLLELAGLPVSTAENDGISIAAALRGGEVPDRPLFWHFPPYSNQGSRPAGAIRRGSWKLIEHYEDHHIELFDLVADPSETNNLAAEQPARAENLLQELRAWRRAVGAQENRPNPAFDPTAHRRLYLDVDVSRLRPTASGAATAAPLRAWREAMDAAVRRR